MFETIKNAWNKDNQFNKKIDTIVNQKVTSILETIEVVKDEDGKNRLAIHTGKLSDRKGKKGFEKITIVDFQNTAAAKQKTTNPRTNLTAIYPPYDYEKIDRFFNKEAYFSRSITRQFETLVRNGYGFVSDDPKYISVVRKRLTQIEKNNGSKLDHLFAKMHMDLSQYGVCILRKHYKPIPEGQEENGPGKIQALRTLHPSSLVYYFDSKTGEFKGVDVRTNSSESDALDRGLSNRLKRLIAASNSSNKMPDIPAKDLIFMKIYQDDTNFFPAPPSMQILDDILTLRSIEETIELLIFQYGSPFLHGKVGTPEDPARPGEVDMVRDEVENMASNGFIVTDDRVVFTPINLLNNLADFASLLSYFKTRILIGVGSSGVSIGEGDTANRSTAASIDDSLADHCMYYGGVMAFVMNYYIIPEILKKEANMSDPTDDDGDLLVEMAFNEVKLDKQIAIENSVINQFQANLLPHNRAMKKLKQIPMKSEEEKELYLNKIQIPLAEAGKTLTPGGSSSTSPRSASQPSNQHGKKAGPGSTQNMSL